MTQNNISRLESPEYGKHTISSLKKIAAAMDVALEVKFVPFSQYVDWLSGTPYLDEGIRPDALAVPGFDEEENQGVFSRPTPAFWGMVKNITPQVKIDADKTQETAIAPFEMKTASPLISKTERLVA